MTEYQIKELLKNLAVSVESQDYTERVMNQAGNKVTCTCLVTSQVHNVEYPRYTITWNPSQEDGYIQAAYHFYCPDLKTGFSRIAKIYPGDSESAVTDKITNALLSGLARGKKIYDGDNLGPYDSSYTE